MEILDDKLIKLAQSRAAVTACRAAQSMLSCMVMNRGLTELTKWISPFVDTSDCAVTVGFSDCGLITPKDLCSVEW